MAAPIGEIDNLVLIDSGGGNGQGSAFSRFADQIPSMIAKYKPVLDALGLDISGMLGSFDSEGSNTQATQASEAKEQGANPEASQTSI